MPETLVALGTSSCDDDTPSEVLVLISGYFRIIIPHVVAGVGQHTSSGD
jgi:hypothetical protein